MKPTHMHLKKMEILDPAPAHHKETHTLGEETRLRCVSAEPDTVDRPWLAGQTVCKELGMYQILHVGVMHARYPYEVVRLRQGGACFLQTLRGRGRVLIGGTWQVIEEGQACLLPAYQTNAIHCIEGEEWDFCWVRYRHPSEQVPLITVAEPIISDFSSDQISAAIHGVLAEAEENGSSVIVEQWARLIHLYVKRFVSPYQSDERLWELWLDVEKNLVQDWTLDMMASKVGLSSEHVRRLCKEEHGKSPMQQVRWMRMQRASELLLTTEYKIESIGYDVGYKNSTVFSSAFRKQFGMNPSEYRAKNALTGV